MRKQLYSLIRTALEEIPEIAHIDLYNNQLQFAEQERPFDTPAALIEFAPIEWLHHTHGVREATVQIILHIVTHSTTGSCADSIATFDLIDRINAILHGISSTHPHYGTIDALTLQTSATDHNFDTLADNTETYTAHILDLTSRRP